MNSIIKSLKHNNKKTFTQVKCDHNQIINNITANDLHIQKENIYIRKTKHNDVGEIKKIK